MKNKIATAATAAIVVALTVLSVVLGDRAVDPGQWATLRILIIICACSAAYCFVVGEITHNYSQMDKLWSLLPIAYSWIIAVRGGMGARQVVFALIVTAWGVRLTVNFARKGAYRLKFWQGNEDYRWSIVRKSKAFSRPILWTLFDLLFISVYQNLLVLAICLPSLAAVGSEEPFGAFDVAATALSVAFLALETVSDEYQWRFHQNKNKLLSALGSLSALPHPYDLGFNTTGPWAFMRHPNYLGEQGVWLSLYLFTVGAKAVKCGVFSVFAVGPLLLVLLFMGSSALGEAISASKYPLYRDYIAQVFKYLPFRRFDLSRCGRGAIKLESLTYSPGYGDMRGEYHSQTLSRNAQGGWALVSRDRPYFSDPITVTTYEVDPGKAAELAAFIVENGVLDLASRPKDDLFATDYSPWEFAVSARRTVDGGVTDKIYRSFDEYKRYTDRDREILRELCSRLEQLRGGVISAVTESEG